MRLTARLALLAAAALPAAHARAQSAQPFSIQASVLATSLKLGRTGNIGGVGGEAQGRYSPPNSPISVGVGAQYTTHSSFNPDRKADDKLTLSGAFVEPRVALPITSSLFGVYVAARLAALHQSNNFGTSSNGWAAGGGGGVLVQLSRTVNFDAGAAVVRQSLGEVTLAGGVRGTFPSFTSYVAKAGLSVGFGKAAL